MIFFATRSSSATCVRGQLPGALELTTWATKPFSTSSAPPFSPFVDQLVDLVELDRQGVLVALVQARCGHVSLDRSISSRMNASGCHR